MAKNPDKNYSKLGRKKNCIYFFLRSSQAGVFYFLSNCSNLSSWTWSCAPGFLFQLFLLLVLLRKKKSAKGGKKSSAPAKGKKGKKNASEEEGEVASDDDDKEFDDGLDEDLIGEKLFSSGFAQIELAAEPHSLKSNWDDPSVKFQISGVIS